MQCKVWTVTVVREMNDANMAMNAYLSFRNMLKQIAILSSPLAVVFIIWNHDVKC